jgi:UDP-glucose 4-epimerase
MLNFHIPRKSSRILITGGMGFIGSHLTEALLNKDCQVTILDNLSTGSFENVQHLMGHPNLRFVVDNLTSEVVLDRLASECDTIIHLAAAVGVKLVVEDPARTIETNVMGTDAILQAALRYRVKVMIASTSEVYGKGIRFPFSEDDDVVLGSTANSRWGYAASKMVDEFLGLAYYRQRGLPVVIFRLFNTVGPRQTGHYGMVVPRLVQQAISGEQLTVYGDGQQSRCFCHVEDAVRAIIGLSECPEAIGQVFNIGSTEEVSILQLAQRVLKTVNQLDGAGLGSTDDIKYIPYAQAYAEGFEDMRRRVPNISKINQYIGWQPRATLDDILRDVVLSMLPDKVSVNAA